MSITLKDVSEVGLEVELLQTIRAHIVDDLDDGDVKERVAQILKIAGEDGLVGPSMMRVLTILMSEKAIRSGLYTEIVSLHDRVATMVKKRDALEKTPASSKTTASKSTSEPAFVFEFDQIDHPDKPLILEKHGNKFPVNPESLWQHRRTQGIKATEVFYQESRTKEDHFKACEAAGVSTKQTTTWWDYFFEDGTKATMFGWRLKDVGDKKFQLIPSDPKSELWHTADPEAG